MFLSKKINGLFLALLIGLTLPIQAMDAQQPQQSWLSSLSQSISTKKAALFAGVAAVGAGVYFYWRYSNLQAALVRAQEDARLAQAQEAEERTRLEREATAQAEQERVLAAERENQEAERLKALADNHYQNRLQRNTLTLLQNNVTEQREQREQEARADAHHNNQLQRNTFNQWQSHTTQQKEGREWEQAMLQHCAKFESEDRNTQDNTDIENIEESYAQNLTLWAQEQETEEQERLTEAAEQEIREARELVSARLAQVENEEQLATQVEIANYKINLSKKRNARPRTRRTRPSAIQTPEAPQPVVAGPSQSATPENPMLVLFRMQNAITSAHTRTFGVNNIFKRELEFVDEWNKVITDIHACAQDKHPNTAYVTPFQTCIEINEKLVSATQNAFSILFTINDRLSEEDITPIQQQFEELAHAMPTLKEIQESFADGHIVQPAVDDQDFTLIDQVPEEEKYLETLLHHVALTLECTIKKVCREYQNKIRTCGIDRANTDILPVASSTLTMDNTDIRAEMEILHNYIQDDNLERLKELDECETIMKHVHRIGLQHMKIHTWLANQLIYTDEIQAIQIEYQSLGEKMNTVFSVLVDHAHRCIPTQAN